MMIHSPKPSSPIMAPPSRWDRDSTRHLLRILPSPDLNTLNRLYREATSLVSMEDNDVEDKVTNPNDHPPIGTSSPHATTQGGLLASLGKVASPSVGEEHLPPVVATGVATDFPASGATTYENHQRHIANNHSGEIMPAVAPLDLNSLNRLYHDEFRRFRKQKRREKRQNIGDDGNNNSGDDKDDDETVHHSNERDKNMIPTVDHDIVNVTKPQATDGNSNSFAEKDDHLPLCTQTSDRPVGQEEGEDSTASYAAGVGAGVTSAEHNHSSEALPTGMTAMGKRAHPPQSPISSPIPTHVEDETLTSAPTSPIILRSQSQTREKSDPSHSNRYGMDLNTLNRLYQEVTSEFQRYRKPKAKKKKTSTIPGSAAATIQSRGAEDGSTNIQESTIFPSNKETAHDLDNEIEKEGEVNQADSSLVTQDYRVAVVTIVTASSDAGNIVSRELEPSPPLSTVAAVPPTSLVEELEKRAKNKITGWPFSVVKDEERYSRDLNSMNRLFRESTRDYKRHRRRHKQQSALSTSPNTDSKNIESGHNNSSIDRGGAPIISDYANHATKNKPDTDKQNPQVPDHGQQEHQAEAEAAEATISKLSVFATARHEDPISEAQNGSTRGDQEAPVASKQARISVTTAEELVQQQKGTIDKGAEDKHIFSGISGCLSVAASQSLSPREVAASDDSTAEAMKGQATSHPKDNAPSSAASNTDSWDAENNVSVQTPSTAANDEGCKTKQPDGYSSDKEEQQHDGFSSGERCSLEATSTLTLHSSTPNYLADSASAKQNCESAFSNPLSSLLPWHTNIASAKDIDDKEQDANSSAISESPNSNNNSFDHWYHLAAVSLTSLKGGFGEAKTEPSRDAYKTDATASCTLTATPNNSMTQHNGGNIPSSNSSPREKPKAGEEEDEVDTPPTPSAASVSSLDGDTAITSSMDLNSLNRLYRETSKELRRGIKAKKTYQAEKKGVLMSRLKSETSREIRSNRNRRESFSMIQDNLYLPDVDEEPCNSDGGTYQLFPRAEEGYTKESIDLVL